MTDSQNENPVNIPLLRKAVEWVEQEAQLSAKESAWDQDDWVRNRDAIRDMISRKLDVVRNAGDQESAEGYRNRLDELGCGTTYCVAGYVGQLLEEGYTKSSMVGDLHVADFAQKALGLTDKQGDALFDSDNTAEDVRRIAETIAGEKL